MTAATLRVRVASTAAALVLIGLVAQVSLAGAVNQPPAADAGPDQTVPQTPGGTGVTLDGTGSTDPDGDTLTYFWTGLFNGGTMIGATPTVTFPTAGTHEVTLMVDDGNGGTDTDTVTITVQAASGTTATPSPAPAASQLPDSATAGNDAPVTVEHVLTQRR